MTLTSLEAGEFRRAISTKMADATAVWPKCEVRGVASDWALLTEIGWFDLVATSVEGDPSVWNLLSSVAEDFGRLLGTFDFASLTLGMAIASVVSPVSANDVAGVSAATPIVAPVAVLAVATRVARVSRGREVSGRFVVPAGAADLLLAVPAGGTYLLVRATGERRELDGLDVQRSRCVLEMGWTQVDAILHSRTNTFKGHRLWLDAITDVLIAGELIGLATRALDETLKWALLREQFGVPIGSFQAVKHQCVDMFVRLEMSRSLARAAAVATGRDPDGVADLASKARAYASSSALWVIRRGIHLHGGLGFTWEHPLHVCYRRAIDLMSCHLTKTNSAASQRPAQSGPEQVTTLLLHASVGGQS